MAIIKKEDVNVKQICKILNSAAIETEVDEEGDVYLKKGGVDFGLWVKFIDESRIRLFTYAQCKSGVSPESVEKFAVKLNLEYVLVRYTSTAYDDGNIFLNGDSYIIFPFGLQAENFVATVKAFSSIFIDSIRAEDPDDEFFS